MNRILFSFYFSLLFASVLFGQIKQDSSSKTSGYNYIRGYSLGVGDMSLGVSQFNAALNQLGNSAPPAGHFVITLSRITCNPATRLYKSWGLVEQNYSSYNSSPGSLSYSFTRVMLSGNAGYLALNSKYFMIPIQGGLALSSMLFNSHVSSVTTPNQSFASAVANGTGGGVFNMENLDVLATLTGGFDVKTQLFRYKNNRIYSTNIGIRISYFHSVLNTNAQWDEGLKHVTNLPHTDRNLFYFGFHVTRLLNDHKGKR